MEPKAKLEQMLEFTNSYLKENSFGLGNTTDKNRFKITAPKGNYWGLVLLNEQIPMEQLLELHRKNLRDFGSEWLIFYKDGKTFFKRMVDSSAWRTDKSLKKYTAQQINEILTLTIQERNAIFNFDSQRVKDFSSQHLKGQKIIYYQPKIAHLIEGIRKFEPQSVHFDYSHLSHDNAGFEHAKDTISKMYFFLKEPKKPNK